MAKPERDQLQRDIQARYKREHEELGSEGTLELLERGRRWELSGTLRAGGVVVFPHAGVGDCGHHVAAAVHACLDSGADRVVVISVLHAMTGAMEQARRRVAAGGDVTKEEFWGIQGTGLDGRQEWKNDHALYSWRHFWRAETRRRGLTEGRAPEVFERYPYLAGGRPEILPGIDDLAELVKDAALVATTDPFHHGLGYGTPPDEAFHPDAEGRARAQEVIEQGITILEEGDYWGYNQHCVQAKSDGRDAGQVFRYLRGPMKGRVVDMTSTDTAELYKQPPPTWVAAPLVEWRPLG
jgi:hypothetical protein